MNKISKGFTLIEVLLVLALIGILSALLYPNIMTFRQRSRDAQRKKDLFTLQTALEVYRSDVDEYPLSLPNCGDPLNSGSIIVIQKIPCDPSDSSQSYIYNQISASSYTLTACLENVNDKDRDIPVNPLGACITTLTVTSP